MKKEKRLICVNCQLAIITSVQLKRRQSHEAPSIRTEEVLMNNLTYRLKLCPGKPWCGFTDLEKDRLNG